MPRSKGGFKSKREEDFVFLKMNRMRSGMKKLKFKIEGMHCTSCAMSIDGDLEDLLEGIKSACTSYAKQETEIEFEERKVKIEQIIQIIKDTGYSAKVKQ
ncbi:MAG TPA: heavy-metal-associated domain-containing protein [Patescibacteria group bacterium]|nr:heavy-metal-associated domain-containing protein [Patescibacteria group bacterium]